MGKYILSGNSAWKQSIEKAGLENTWFTPDFVSLAAEHIAKSLLDEAILKQWAASYFLPEEKKDPGTVGIVMAGNIPLVGFHDFLSVFISGHKALIKTSSKDSILIRHLAEKIIEWEAETRPMIRFEEMLKNCDAYIATGNNSSSRYFLHYFGKYPHIIRRNRTSAALLWGNETVTDLEKLADDVFLYFGLGCRNVTKIFVPHHYDFVPLLNAFKKYEYFAEHHKYKNNYDYNLTLHILNNKYYMTNGAVLLSENESLFSPISQLHYEFYNDRDEQISLLSSHSDLQCVVGSGQVPFGQSQFPRILDYADGVDTLQFLARL